MIDVLSFLGDLVTLSPLLIAWIVGLFLAATHWNRHPKAARRLATGLVVLAFSALFFRLVFRLLPRYLDNIGTPIVSVTWLFPLLGFVSSAVSALGWAFVLAAVFADREPERVPLRRRRPPWDDAGPEPESDVAPTTDIQTRPHNRDR